MKEKANIMFRNKYNLKDCDKILIIEDEGTLRIIPIESAENLRKNSYSSEEMKAEMNKSRNEELAKES